MKLAILPVVLAGALWGPAASLAHPYPTRAKAVHARAASGGTIAPRDLLKLMHGPKASRPLVLQVGFKVLYDGGHIPGSTFAGPASSPGGLADLDRVVSGVSRGREIVVYCGCCPWQHCPNVRPALAELHRLGFHDVRALYIPRDFYADWIQQGLPVAR